MDINHGDAMRGIIHALYEGRLIEAITQHRALYNVGLKQSKDAVEAIRHALGLTSSAKAVYGVFYRHNVMDDFIRSNVSSFEEARALANDQLKHTPDCDLCIVRVVSRTVTKKVLEDC